MPRGSKNMFAFEPGKERNFAMKVRCSIIREFITVFVFGLDDMFFFFRASVPSEDSCF